MSVTGKKTFTGTVKLHLDDTALGTFNDVDLGAAYSSQAFIDEDTSFPAADSFTSIPACSPGWTYLEHTGKCYNFIQSKTSWSNARKTCKSNNPSSDLASVPDKTTNDFLVKLTGGPNEWTWLGGSQFGPKDWRWTDGSDWTGYTNWGPGQPDNTGGHLHLYNQNAVGQWNDNFEDKELKFICQSDPSISSPSLLLTVPSLRAKESLNITASIVKTDTGSDINLEKLYQNTILKSSDDTVSVKGSLVFTQDVTLNADSTIGSLDDSDSSLSIPGDLILTDATEFSGSPGKHFKSTHLLIFKNICGDERF